MQLEEIGFVTGPACFEDGKTESVIGIPKPGLSIVCVPQNEEELGNNSFLSFYIVAYTLSVDFYFQNLKRLQVKIC